MSRRLRHIACRFALRCALLLSAGVLLAGCAAEAQPGARGTRAETTIRLGHGLDPSHPVHRGMERMAEALDSLSGGQVALQIYPSEQLGTERQCLELLQIGSLDMTKVSSAVMEGFAPLYRVFGLPYIFRDDAHRFAVLEGETGQRILRSSEDVWLRGVGFYDAGSRSFYTRDTPVRTPADLEGLKIRVQESPVAIAMVNQLGGAATPISWGELYTALQQGVVDGAENNPPSYHLSRQYEVTGFFSLDEHTAPPDVLLVSTHLWERLSERERAWLEEAVAISVDYQKWLWQRASEEALKAVQEAGVEVIRPDKAPFREAVEPLYAQVRREEPEVYALLQEIRRTEAQAAAEVPDDGSAATIR